MLKRAAWIIRYLPTRAGDQETGHRSCRSIRRQMPGCAGHRHRNPSPEKTQRSVREKHVLLELIDRRRVHLIGEIVLPARPREGRQCPTYRHHTKITRAVNTQGYHASSASRRTAAVILPQRKTEQRKLGMPRLQRSAMPIASTAPASQRNRPSRQHAVRGATPTPDANRLPSVMMIWGNTWMPDKIGRGSAPNSNAEQDRQNHPSRNRNRLLVPIFWMGFDNCNERFANPSKRIPPQRINVSKRANRRSRSLPVPPRPFQAWPRNTNANRQFRNAYESAAAQ